MRNSFTVYTSCMISNVHDYKSCVFAAYYRSPKDEVPNITLDDCNFLWDKPLFFGILCVIFNTYCGVLVGVNNQGGNPG